MARLSLSTLLIAALALAGGLTGLTGCAEAQRMVNDAGRIVDTAGGVAGNAGVTTTTEASWATKAIEHRGRAGTFAFDCLSTESIPGNSVWGSNPYTDDSSVCKAGVHSGVITARGGRVLIQMRPGQNRYAGSTRNGIRTRDYGSWSGSFVVVTN